MALRYVVKKRMIGFGKEKTEKYVAQNVITNTVNFRDLCKEVSMFGMIPGNGGVSSGKKLIIQSIY